MSAGALNKPELGERPQREREMRGCIRAFVRMFAGREALFLVIVGCVSLLCQNVSRLSSLLPKAISSRKGYAPSLPALAVSLLGVVWLVWPRLSAFFTRWGRNREPVLWDALFPGAAAGILLHFLRKGTGEGVWQSIWLVPFLAMCSIWIWRAQTLSRNQTSVSRARSGQPLNDEPLADLTIDTDAFGRLTFAAALADAVLDSDPATCHVIGLAGPWGSGKTSIIPAVSAKCQAAGLRVITIDAWAFRETGRLTEAVLTKVVTDIDDRYLLPNLRRTLVRYLSIISPVVSKVPVLEALSKALAGADELDKLRNSLSAVVQSTQERFLVIVDDVDRLDQAELQSLIKTVRLCASIPRITYLLAYDRASIHYLIANDDPSLARDFMDKVVEDEWCLPLVPHDKLVEYIKKHCAASLSDRAPRFRQDFEERLKECLPGLRHLLRTPRQIRRAGISLSRRSILLAKLNPFDAFLWQVLRQREPALHEFITQRPWLLRRDHGLLGNWAVGLMQDKERRKKEIKQIEDLIEQTPDTAESTKVLFWALFAKEEQLTDAAEAMAIKLRRISNSRFFDAYFLLDPGFGAARPHQIDSLIAELNAADSPQVAKDAASQAMETALKEDWISTWIALAAIFCDDLNRAAINPVVEAVREFHDRHLDPKSRESGELVRSLARLNAQLVGHLPDDAEATVVAAELLTKTANLALAANYARLLERDSYGYGSRSLDIDHLRAVLDDRLEGELMNHGTTVFQQQGDLLGTLIYFYSDKARLWDFLTTAAGSDAINWARCIRQLVVVWEQDSPEMNLRQIAKVPPAALEKAFEVLSRADLSQCSSAEVGATRTFIEWWPSSRGGRGLPPAASIG